jgi:hypothetical protein
MLFLFIRINSDVFRKIQLNGNTEFAEVQFYFMQENINGELVCYALVSLYGPPDADLLEDSYHTLWACAYLGNESLIVIKAESIISVVSMQPLPSLEGEEENRWFVVEKSGLDDTDLTGYVDAIDGEV